MTSLRWQQIKTILADVLECSDETARRDVLDQGCAGDAELRSEVESFLERESTNLDKFADESGLLREAKSAAAANVGRRLGAYELVREIGRGGMGTVYLAQRADGRFEQQVAVKLLKRGTDTDEVLRRFRAERRILARLEHPGIARLLDGGETDEGLPFFVMEHVAGTPLTEFARTHGLSIAARLELFIKVCAAVQFAHQNLVVHRDLKPGNILVTAGGEPKLLDFGLARLLSPTDEDSPALTITLAESRRLTPAFASPEQVRGESLTTASDVYSLGALLYELLTDQPPHRFSSPHPPPQELLRVIGEQEPPRPSFAADAGTRSRLRGDLDNIIGLAMRKEPARRYGSVGAFAEDLRRHLDSRPVRARADTWRYRTAKFVGRNKTGIAVGALVFTALLITSVAAVWEAWQSARQARLAERRYNDVRALAHSFLFEFHDAIRDLPGSTPARRLLVTRALEYLDGLARESGGDPTLQRELAGAYLRVGDVQGRPNRPNLGDVVGALKSYRQAVAVAEALPDDEGAAATRADAWDALGSLLAASVSTQEEAFRLIRRALKVREARLARRPQEPAARRAVAVSLMTLGDAVFSHDVDVRYRRDDTVSAQQIYRRALSLYDGLHAELPTDSVDTGSLAGLHCRLGSTCCVLGEIEHADRFVFGRGMEHYRRGIALFEENLAAHPASTQMKRDLADGLAAKADLQTRFGDAAGALTDCRRAITTLSDLAEADPDNYWARLDLAYGYYQIIYPQRATGDLRGAVESSDRAAAIYGALADKNPNNLAMVSCLGSILRVRTGLCQERGDLTGAQASARRWLQCAERLSAAMPDDAALRAELALARAAVQEIKQP